MLRNLFARAAPRHAMNASAPLLMAAAAPSRDRAGAAPSGYTPSDGAEGAAHYTLAGLSAVSTHPSSTPTRSTGAAVSTDNATSALTHSAMRVGEGDILPASSTPPHVSRKKGAVMTKAKRIRLAAAAAASEEAYKAAGSPHAFSILGQQLRTLRDEEKLLSASLDRLRAERKLAQMRESFEEVKHNFAAGMLAREAVALGHVVPTTTLPSQKEPSEYTVEAFSTEKTERAAGPDATNALNRQGTTTDGASSGAIDDVTVAAAAATDGSVERLHAAVLSAAVAGDLIGLAATADAEAAATRKRPAGKRRGTAAPARKPRASAAAASAATVGKKAAARGTRHSTRSRAAKKPATAKGATTTAAAASHRKKSTGKPAAARARKPSPRKAPAKTKKPATAKKPTTKAASKPNAKTKGKAAPKPKGKKTTGKKR